MIAGDSIPAGSGSGSSYGERWGLRDFKGGKALFVGPDLLLTSAEKTLVAHLPWTARQKRRREVSQKFAKIGKPGNPTRVEHSQLGASMV
ncbi:hypothetical protein NL676_007556 [Syzygium grande]|nr:hypothetical protein NL676_007556 [Syzygium grande]